jgi:hypothetical protein
MTIIPNGAVFIIRDVPLGAAERFREVVGDAGYVVIPTTDRQ